MLVCVMQPFAILSPSKTCSWKHKNIFPKYVSYSREVTFQFFFFFVTSVFRALESDTYDHITATYYLMAEAYLRQTRQDTDADKETHLVQRRRLMRKLSQPDVFSNSLLPSPTYVVAMLVFPNCCVRLGQCQQFCLVKECNRVFVVSEHLCLSCS